MLQLSPPPVRHRFAADSESANPFAAAWAAVASDLTRALARVGVPDAVDTAALTLESITDLAALSEYDRVQPGMGAIVTRLVLDEIEHQRALAAFRRAALHRDAEAHRGERRRGRTYCLVLVTVAGAAGLVTAALGQEWFAAVVGGAGPVAFGLMFLAIGPPSLDADRPT